MLTAIVCAYNEERMLPAALYSVRNFWSETIHHRPKDLAHEDVRL